MIENKQTLKVNVEDKRLLFNGDSIKLNDAFYGMEIVNRKKGLRLNYGEFDYFNLNYESRRIKEFLEDNKLEKVLRVFKFPFPQNSILITK